MIVKPNVIQHTETAAEPVLINCTPHPVSIYVGTVFDEKTRRSTGGWLQKEIPPSGKKAVVVSSTHRKPELKLDGTIIPMCARRFESISYLPKKDGVFYIVPSLYITAVKELGVRDTDDLLVPYGEVCDGATRS